MVRHKMVWLASWPRSGNTFLRTIMWQCFGLRSGSIYPGDMANNRQLEEYVGHVEDKNNLFVDGNVPLIKTHEPPSDNSPAIYVVREGKTATLSLCQFYRDTPPEFVVEGRHRFGTWTNHLQLWKPWERPDTLLLRYEDIENDMPATLGKISLFLGVEILKDTLPPRDAIAGIDGRIVKKEGVAKPDFSGTLSARFEEINGEMLRKMGYR